MNAPFDPVEERLWMYITNVAVDFLNLEHTHPSDKQEAVEAIHKLQDILGRRVLRRSFPGSFASYKNTPNGWVQVKE